MSDGFDASEAAGRAVGDLADGSIDADVDAATDESDDDDGSDPTSSTSLTHYLTPLVFAPERGPTTSTFCGHGCSRSIGQILDGITDYILDLLDRDPGDNIGPLGKIGLGISNFGADRSSTSDDDGDDGADGSAAPTAGGAGGV